jgi:hypothetical protein
VKSVFFRLVDENDKSYALRVAAKSAQPVDYRIEVDSRDFASLPGAPFSYWVPKSLMMLFGRLPHIQSSETIVCSTNPLNDDFRFTRLAWEVDLRTIGSSWIFWAKGGAQSDFYADISNLISWDPDRWRFRAFIGTVNRPIERPASSQYFMRPGITWPKRTSGLSMRAMPAMCAFGDKGPAIFMRTDDTVDLLSLLAIVCSRTFKYLVGVQLARVELAQSFEVGLIQRTPVPRLLRPNREQLASLAHKAWSLHRQRDTATEVSHAFVAPALLQVDGSSLDVRARRWTERIAGLERDLRRTKSEVDETCFELYGIAEEDRRAIFEGFDSTSDTDEAHDTGDGNGDRDVVVDRDPTRLAAELVSWAVGVVVGRFDLRLATGERLCAEEPAPFDPLPVCSPGMLTDDDGLPPISMPTEYRIGVSPLLVDDPGHQLDITARVRSVFEAVFSEEADNWWRDVGVVLDAKGGEIGGWLSRSFFDHHLKVYSKSRRKAPVLWPIGTRSGFYVVWLYAHRVSADLLFQVLNDIVVPKLAMEERELTQLREDAGTNPSASQRKSIDTKEQLVGELREFREELEAVAPLWAPNPDDGVVLMLAPLWRLFAHHRAWSNELKRHWAKLAKGDYDWAQLAMRLWPDRVVSKCAEDRSLAIAHGLEDVFWAQDPDNEDKWLPRPIPTMTVDHLIAQHHNLAATAALQRVNT